MSDNPRPNVGTIGWLDITVPQADVLRDFYREVVGWQAQEVDIGEYADYTMHAPSGEAVAGICYARGQNADQPPQWLMYIVVADIHASLTACEQLGGTILVPLRDMGGSMLSVIQDPAGAVAALFQPA